MSSSRTPLTCPNPAVQISRDEHGIPHINAPDLAQAYWGLGWCHALDRTLPMVLLRTLGRGHATKILDDSEEMLEVDTFFRRMNWAANADLQSQDLEPRWLEVVNAYCEGVTARLSTQWRPTLKVLGITPDPWTPEDCVLLARMTAYLTLVQTQAEAEHLIVQLVQEGTPREYLEELFPGVLGELDEELLMKVVMTHSRLVPESVAWSRIVRPHMSSNNWAISGSRTASGNAILASDPHLEVNRVPPVWYEAVLNVGDRWIAGGTMPGLPAIMIGRTPDLAWGVTYSQADVVDSWVEDCKDGTYRRDEEWLPFTERVEVIERKKGEPVKVTFYDNPHGTLDGDPNVAGYYLSTLWTGASSGAASLRALLSLWDAKTTEEGMDCVAHVESGWNFVLADSDGSVGYQMSGLMPKRREGITGLVPVPGWDPANDWLGICDVADLPRSLNPPEGFVASANEDLNHLGNIVAITLPMGSERADRIHQVLGASDKHTIESCQELQLDVYSRQGVAFMEILRPLLPETDNGQTLATWNHRYDVDSVGAFLFEEVYRALLVEVFGSKSYGETVANYISEETSIFADHYLNFDLVLLDESSIWFGGEARDDLYRRVAARALQVEPQRWGEGRQLLFTHILFGEKFPKAFGFDLGPIELPGGRATPRQGQIYRSAGRQTSFAPSYRLVTDLGESVVHTALPGGQSDRRLSPWYGTGLQGWVEGLYKRVDPA